MREKLTNGNPERNLLLYVGRVATEKRIDWLRHILEKCPEVRLAIVGDGPARMALEKKFAGTLTIFTGYLRGEELAQAYASADIFVFPGANETFGNVVIEAMSSGLPVVVPNSGGVVDFVENEANGLHFKAEDPADLISKVRRLLENPDLIRKFGSAARETAESMSWDSVNEEVMHDFETLIQNVEDNKWLRIPRRLLI